MSAIRRGIDRRRTGRGRTRRGATIMEAALVLPVLLMLAFGVVEYGYYFYVQHSMQGAARAGARVGIIAGATTGQVDTAVDSVMSAAGFASNKYTKSYSNLNVSTGSTITVTVQGSWGTVGVHPLPTAMGGISTSKTVKGVTVMVKE